MNDTVKIVKVHQTCAACPSQWDAWTETGQRLYLRFRWGIGTAYFDGPDGEVIAEFTYGSDLDGWISLEKFCELAGLELL